MRADRRIRTSFISIASDMVLIGAKATLGVITGSMALRADALHSASDLGISAVVLAGLFFRRFAEGKNASSKDRKISAKALCRIEAALSYIIACFILYAPYEIATQLISREVVPIQNLGLGVVGILGCIALTGFIARLKVQVGRETGSASLTADGYHSSTDFFSSIAVLFAVMGDAIGINLDPIVALLIALLIGVTGLELFVASTRALIRGEPLKTDDLGEWISKGIRWFFHRPTAVPSTGVATSSAQKTAAVGVASDDTPEVMPATAPDRSPSVRSLNLRPPSPIKLIVGAALAGLLVWALSGLSAIQPDEVGIRLRFGRVVGETLSPGLNFALPYPFEQVLRQKPGEVHRVEIGVRTSADGQERKLFDESIIIAGDESVADLNFAVHFLASDTHAALFRARYLDEIVRSLAESTVREVAATQSVDAMLSDGQSDFQRQVEKRLREEVSALGLGVTNLNVLLTASRPPSAVVPAFRDVFSAREDQLKELQQAEAKRNDAIPKARAESTSRISQARSFSLDRRLRTEGVAERFTLQSRAAADFPEATAYRLFVETAEKGLAGHKKIIADPEANFGGYQLWMFGPTQPPMPLTSDSRGSSRKAVP